MKSVDYCCPNITCNSFGTEYPVTVWEEGDVDEYDSKPILAIDWGDPCYDDDIMCGGCTAECVTGKEFTEALEVLFK